MNHTPSHENFERHFKENEEKLIWLVPLGGLVGGVIGAALTLAGLFEELYFAWWGFLVAGPACSFILVFWLMPVSPLNLARVFAFCIAVGMFPVPALNNIKDRVEGDQTITDINLVLDGNINATSEGGRNLAAKLDPGNPLHALELLTQLADGAIDLHINPTEDIWEQGPKQGFITGGENW